MMKFGALLTSLMIAFIAVAPSAFAGDHYCQAAASGAVRDEYREELVHGWKQYRFVHSVTCQTKNEEDIVCEVEARNDNPLNDIQFVVRMNYGCTQVISVQIKGN